MTKLGVNPAVHGEGGDVEKAEAKDDLTTIKVDPKVFTILQPISPPPQAFAQPQSRRQRFGWGRFFFFTIALISLTMLGLFLVHEFYLNDQDIKETQVKEVSAIQQRPQTDSLKADTNLNNNDVISSIPIARVMVIEGGSQEKDGEKTSQVIDGSVEKADDTQFNMMPANPWAVLEARNQQYLQAMQMARMRRIQQAIYEQQMMREAMARQYWEQQQMMAQAQAARSQWEAARAQQAQIDQARWEHAARLHQEWAAQQQWARAQQQQAQWAAQQQQQPQQWAAQQQWPAQQQWAAQQQQWSQPQQWAQHQNQWQQPQQAQQAQNPEGPARHWFRLPIMPRVVLFRNFGRQPVQQQPAQTVQPQIPERPETSLEASGSSEVPQPAIHDRIYQELQKKSQGMEFNQPTRQVWTAITPTPETPAANYDQDAIFQENLKKALELEAQQTTVAPTTGADKSDEDDSKDDSVFQEIFSAMAAAAEKAEATTTTTVAPVTSTENVFKVFGSEDDKKEKQPENVFKTFESEEDKKKIEVPTAQPDNVFKTFESEEDKKVPVDGAPVMIPTSQEENVFKPFASEERKGEMVDSAETPEPVVIEDSFPRIEERTTTPETSIENTSSEKSAENAPSVEDPLAAFLKYFEEEARKMAASQQRRVTVDSDTAQVSTVAPIVEGAGAQQQPEVDVPEPHFQPITI